ncbi:c-type cytochrome [Methylobacterium nigriterrae]|uniref:c-type cytochrome n=1 Tax=Methylobacterium nigriterrae TaxID=3127512 RepID=UPI0030140B1B
MTRDGTVASLLGALAAAAAFSVVLFVVGPASAHKAPVSREQLKSYDDAFMDAVKKGDLLFHGDAATAKAMGVNLSNSGMACAMCHPHAADTHPHTFPKFQAQIGKFSTLRDMVNWCIEKPMQGEQIEADSEAMKDLEAYIYWSNTGSVLTPGKY